MLLPSLLPLLPLLLLLATGAEGSGFWNSRFATNEFARFHYLNKYTVTIFQHVTKNSSFYFTPLVLLDHESGRVTHNTLTEFHELRLRVIMWNTELKNHVYNFLREKTSMRRPEVKALPLEKVRFAWKSRYRRIKRQLVLENEFMSTHHMPSQLTLTLASKNASEVSELNRKIRTNPEILDRLVLECFMTTKKSAMKTVTVTINHLMKSRTFSKLLNLPPDGNYHYIRVDDFNELAHETFSNVKATTIRSTEYVDKSDEVNIIALIENALKQDEVLATSLSAGQWRSVFWNPMFARPDRVLREANRSFSLDASDGRLRLNGGYVSSSTSAKKMFSKSKGRSHSWSAGNWLGHVGGSVEGASSETRRESLDSAYDSGKFSKEQVNSLMRQRGLAVEWNGEKFVTKPMRLVRVNRRSFESKRKIVSESMQLTLYEQTISLQVRIVGGASNSSFTMTGPVQSSGFPTQHSYCLLSNGGSCPPGFIRSQGHVKGIQMDVDTPGNIRKGQLGDSAIKCHSPDDSNNCAFTAWEPYKAEIHLFVCCR